MIADAAGMALQAATWTFIVWVLWRAFGPRNRGGN
jgi:hypothetical protein